MGLALGLANVANALDPAVIVLGGGVIAAHAAVTGRGQARFCPVGGGA